MPTVHAGCVVIGEAGVLIRGASGAGKSAFARRLIAAARLGGAFARLVADDRVRLEPCHGRLLARPVPGIAGLMEVRGVGVVAAPHEPAALVRLVVDLSPDVPERHPDPGERVATLAGVALPRLAGRPDADLAETVLDRLAAPGPP
jgi:serine kinase of HPr protein (carbohydrate metabolism regulator)